MDLTGLGLAHAALMIAQDEYPALPVARYLKKLDFMGYELQARISADRPSDFHDRLELVTHFLFTEKKFQGNDQDYYDPRNSFLNDVLDRRLGLPITLAILTQEMCARVGLKAWGIGLPSHFVVGVDVGNGSTVALDPFRNGARIQSDGAQARMMDKRATLTRLLNNLKVIYWNDKRFDKALPVVERLVELNPDHSPEYRDRGLANYQLKRYAYALLDLERYLAGVPESPEERPWIEEMIRWLRKRVNFSPMLH
jgi:regulator of sirC expression with transglutaminase-like and TPR domain